MVCLKFDYKALNEVIEIKQTFKYFYCTKH